MGLYTITPVRCAAHQGISAAATPRRTREKGGCSESTWRTVWQRSRRATSKLDTPAARTLPCSTSLTRAPHESSTGMPVSSGQWNWKRSMRSTPRRRSDASHSRGIESGRRARFACFMRSASSQWRPHFVKTSGRSADGRSRRARPTTSSECPSP